MAVLAESDDLITSCGINTNHVTMRSFTENYRQCCSIRTPRDRNGTLCRCHINTLLRPPHP